MAAAIRKRRALTLAQQCLNLKANPICAGRGASGPSGLHWRFAAAPDPLGRIYDLRIMQAPCQRPRVYVDGPDLHALAGGRQLPLSFHTSTRNLPSPSAYTFRARGNGSRGCPWTARSSMGLPLAPLLRGVALLGRMEGRRGAPAGAPSQHPPDHLKRATMPPIDRHAAEPARQYRILSLDGGGIRGVFPAAILAKLEEHLDEPIGRYFDLIVGTSTGGIIAIGLGLGLTAREILAFYEERGPEISTSTGGPWPIGSGSAPGAWPTFWVTNTRPAGWRRPSRVF